MTPTNALVYSETKHSNTDYLAITAYCNDCKKVNKINPTKFDKYQIKKNPSLLKVTIACIQHNDHYHDTIKIPFPVTVPINSLPHKYIIKNYNVIGGYCKEYIETISCSKNSKKKNYKDLERDDSDQCH